MVKEKFNEVKNTLTLNLYDNIDSSNSSEFENKVNLILNSYKDAIIEIDCTNLNYISSAGLRVLLKIAKSKKYKISINNVSSEVYEIFDVTGFSTVFNVQKKFREISLNDCELIGEGGNGKVLRLDKDSIVKIYKNNLGLEDIMRERNYAQKAFLAGIPTAISYDIVTCNGSYGIVFELINSDTFGKTLMNNLENYNNYSSRYAQLLKDIHQIQIHDLKLPNTKDLYHQKIDKSIGFYTDEEINALHELINCIPDSHCVIHGDFHPKNIMVQNNEFLLIDMDDISYGHPIFDFGGIYLTHIMTTQSGNEFTERMIGVSSEISLKLYKDLINYYFKDKNPSEIDQIKKIIQFYGLMKFAVHGVLSTSLSDETKNLMRNIVRQNFFPYIDELKGKMPF